MPERDHGGSSDAALAFLYASGELDGQEADVFEHRLGEEQPLREALCQAVQLLQTLEGLQPLAPRPAYRERVRRRLCRRGPWQWLARPRTYRGHPAFWTMLGAAAAVLAVLAVPPGWLPATRQPMAETSPNPPSPLREPQAAEAESSTIEMAEVWATLSNTEHLARARADEHRRRDRRLARGEDHAHRLPGLFGDKN